MSDGDALLRGLRRTGDEAQFTQVIANVAAAEPVFAGALARVLVNAAPPNNAELKAEDVPAELYCRAEETVRTAGDVRKGRVDLLFHTGEFDFRLFVELKLASPYGENQVGRYLDALADMSGRRGLLAVTTNLPAVGEPAAGDPHWLGSLRWRRVLPGLRRLADLLSEPLGGQWRQLLYLMESDGDFGMRADKIDITGWARYVHTREALGQLIEELAAHAVEQLRSELSVRPAWARYSRDAIVDHVYRGAEKKTSYPTQRTVEARLRLPASGPVDRPRVVIQFLGGFQDPYFTVEARRPAFMKLEADSSSPAAAKFRAAVKLLDELQPHFAHDPRDRRGYYARVHGPHEWLADAGPNPEELLALMRQDLTDLVASGILDPDSGFDEDLHAAAEPESAADA